MLVWFNVYFLMNKFKQLCKSYDLVDHESFCIITNESASLISVADLNIIVNTNICSWVTHYGRGWDEYLKVLRMSSVGSSIYRICQFLQVFPVQSHALVNGIWVCLAHGLKMRQGWVCWTVIIEKTLFEGLKQFFFLKKITLNLRSSLMKLLYDIFFGFFDVKNMKKICQEFF